MKKVLLVLLAICLLLTGCKKEENEEKKVTGGWENIVNNKSLINDSELELFNNAKKDSKLEAVALLAKQVVSGTNYMFLAKDGSKYKIVIVYNDLEGKSSITKVSDFDYTKYTNKNIEDNSEELVGGWNVDYVIGEGLIDRDVQSIFENATATLTGMTYSPIALLGKQVVSGTNYAILCFGKPSYDGMKASVFVVTIYKDLEENLQILSQAYVNLGEYNQ